MGKKGSLSLWPFETVSVLLRTANTMRYDTSIFMHNSTLRTPSSIPNPGSQVSPKIQARYFLLESSIEVCSVACWGLGWANITWCLCLIKFRSSHLQLFYQLCARFSERVNQLSPSKLSHYPDNPPPRRLHTVRTAPYYSSLILSNDRQQHLLSRI